MLGVSPNIFIVVVFNVLDVKNINVCRY